MLGNMERVANTPIPRSYSIHLKQTVTLYLFALPLTLVGNGLVLKPASIGSGWRRGDIWTFWCKNGGTTRGKERPVCMPSGQLPDVGDE